MTGTFIHGSVLLIIVYRLTEKYVHIVLSLKMVPSVESLFQRYILSPLIVRSVWLQYNIHMGKSVSYGDTLPHTIVGVSLW